jgi:hypothetical protein
MSTTTSISSNARTERSSGSSGQTPSLSLINTVRCVQIAPHGSNSVERIRRVRYREQNENLGDEPHRPAFTYFCPKTTPRSTLFSP